VSYTFVGMLFYGLNALFYNYYYKKSTPKSLYKLIKCENFFFKSGLRLYCQVIVNELLIKKKSFTDYFLGTGFPRKVEDVCKIWGVFVGPVCFKSREGSDPAIDIVHFKALITK